MVKITNKDKVSKAKTGAKKVKIRIETVDEYVVNIADLLTDGEYTPYPPKNAEEVAEYLKDMVASEKNSWGPKDVLHLLMDIDLYPGSEDNNVSWSVDITDTTAK